MSGNRVEDDILETLSVHSLSLTTAPNDESSWPGSRWGSLRSQISTRSYRSGHTFSSTSSSAQSKKSWTGDKYVGRSFEASIARCLHEYIEVGLLEEKGPSVDPGSMLRTTDVFLKSNLVLGTYGDIASFLLWAGVEPWEIVEVGLTSVVYIHTTNHKDGGGKVPKLEERLAKTCKDLKLRNPLEYDASARFQWVDAKQLGSRALENAFVAEGQKRDRGCAPSVVLVLVRVLGLAMLCGVREIWMDEIAQILGLGPVFESIARARVAKIRNAHASEVINALIFGGSTALPYQEDKQSSFDIPKPVHKTVVVAYMDPAGKHVIPKPEYEWPSVTFPRLKSQIASREIRMAAGWAELFKHRAIVQSRRKSTASDRSELSSAEDVHGNTYGYTGKLANIALSILVPKEGPLYAAPAKFGKIASLSDAHYGITNVDSAGREKLYGGIVGVPCGCMEQDESKQLFAPESPTSPILRSPTSMSMRSASVPDNSSSFSLRRTPTWPGKHRMSLSTPRGTTTRPNLGSSISVNDIPYTQIASTISHANRLKRLSIGVLWCPGDWAMGLFLMQVLPQSSYLQGRGQCIYCAVEKAAELGCQEVIACGGCPSVEQGFLPPTTEALEQISANAKSSKWSGLIPERIRG